MVALASTPNEAASLRATKPQKISHGWHEGYLVRFRTPVGGARLAFLRIWHSQLSYWRLDRPISRALELRAMEIARTVGIPTPEPLVVGKQQQPLAGECEKDYGGAAKARLDFLCYRFVAHARNHRELPSWLQGKASEQAETLLMLRLMVQLHSCDLAEVDTEPIARFDCPSEHLAYLSDLASKTGQPRLTTAAARVSALFKGNSAPPPLPSALLHYDWHLGNVMLDKQGEVAALIDWEFAGIADPRLDLARFCRRTRWSHAGPGRLRDKGAERSLLRPEGKRNEHMMWEHYARLRFGKETDALTYLGAVEPWLAMECLQVLVMAFSAAIATAAAQRRQGEAGRGTPASKTEGNVEGPLPMLRCDLIEWVEDAYEAEAHLVRLGVLDA